LVTYNRPAGTPLSRAAAVGGDSGAGEQAPNIARAAMHVQNLNVIISGHCSGDDLR
jgi:hypothetical protein